MPSQKKIIPFFLLFVNVRKFRNLTDLSLLYSFNVLQIPAQGVARFVAKQRIRWNFWLNVLLKLLMNNFFWTGLKSLKILIKACYKYFKKDRVDIFILLVNFLLERRTSLKQFLFSTVTNILCNIKRDDYALKIISFNCIILYKKEQIQLICVYDS